MLQLYVCVLYALEIEVNKEDLVKHFCLLCMMQTQNVNGYNESLTPSSILIVLLQRKADEPAPLLSAGNAVSVLTFVLNNEVE